nr:hypothetical protein [Tanacetum cinerariifolium]
LHRQPRYVDVRLLHPGNGHPHPPPARNAAPRRQSLPPRPRRWPRPRRLRLQAPHEARVRLAPHAVAVCPRAPQPRHRHRQQVARMAMPTPSILARTSGCSCTAARSKSAATTIITYLATGTCPSMWR